MTPRNPAVVLSALLLIGLLGCVADQKHEGKQDNQINQPAPTVNVNVPPNQVADTKALKDEVCNMLQTSSNATQNQLSGLLNASVSKIAEQVKGIEARIDTTLSASANAEVKAQLKASLDAITNLQLEIKNTMAVTAKLDNTMTAVADLNQKIGKIQASLDANTTGQLGILSKLESVTNDIKAGRDVNYLPKEAVDIMRSQDKVTMYIIGGILTLLTTLAGYAYKMARMREQNTNKLLMEALGRLQPEQATPIFNKFSP